VDLVALTPALRARANGMEPIGMFHIPELGALWGFLFYIFRLSGLLRLQNTHYEKN
jgi:hypothetical protein